MPENSSTCIRGEKRRTVFPFPKTPNGRRCLKPPFRMRTRTTKLPLPKKLKRTWKARLRWTGLSAEMSATGRLKLRCARRLRLLWAAGRLLFLRRQQFLQSSITKPVLNALKTFRSGLHKCPALSRQKNKEKRLKNLKTGKSTF